MSGRTSLVAALLVVGAMLAPSAPAGAAGATGSIAPGVQMITAGAQCTANFVFRDKRNRLYVGYAAHCAGKGEATDTNGCETPSLPMGTRVRFVTGMNLLSGGTTVGYGRLRYSSWAAMQRAGTTSTLVCESNDFALVEVERAYRGRVDPTFPSYGGPSALGGVPAAGQTVYTYGSSSLRGSSAKSGDVVESNRRAATVFTPSPGIPGDSGSGYLDARGRAFGVLSTVNIAPAAGTNGVGGLALQVTFARRHGFSTLQLVPGRKPFTTSLVR